MVCKKWGMAISVEKSKVLAVGGGEVTALTCLNESYRRGGLLNLPGTRLPGFQNEVLIYLYIHSFK